MQPKRTTVDFSKHVLDVDKSYEEEVIVHHLHLPDTIIYSVKFINTNNLCVVTGDFGNWLFCREFHPSASEAVSDSYWCEKLRISSTQDPYVFDTAVAKKEIKEMLADPDQTLSEEEREWLCDLSDASEEEYNYISKAMDRPGSFDAECIPHGKRTHPQLEAVFDAFDEICQRLKNRRV